MHTYNFTSCTALLSAANFPDNEYSATNPPVAVAGSVNGTSVTGYSWYSQLANAYAAGGQAALEKVVAPVLLNALQIQELGPNAAPPFATIPAYSADFPAPGASGSVTLLSSFGPWVA
jgi:hypothetical protein